MQCESTIDVFHSKAKHKIGPCLMYKEKDKKIILLGYSNLINVLVHTLTVG